VNARKRTIRWWSRWWWTWFRAVESRDGAQIVEFAVALPLLMVFLIGITDFGGAANVKQKLTAAAREGARFGAITPTADLYSTIAAGSAPPSVNALAVLVGNYLENAHVSSCGLATSNWTITKTGPLAWTYTANTGCPGTLTMVIDRGAAVQAGTGGTPYWMIDTQVSLSYPYRWQFNKVIPLLVPTATYAGTSQITTNALVPNLT
jgi:Flp pilus assembly protein TadG